MKTKKVTPSPAFKFLLVIIIALLPVFQAEAMPEASWSLANDCFKYFIYFRNLDLEEYYKNFLDEAHSGIYDAESPGLYENYTKNIAKEISEVRNKTPYTQEQAVDELGRMIDEGQFAANYIFAKGQYKYVSGINAVLTTTNVNLRSQPNRQANILRVISGPKNNDGDPTIDICNYLGEWTSPEGEHWVAVTFDDYYSTGKLTGWLYGKYTQFIRDSQVLQVAKIYEKALAAPRRDVEKQIYIEPPQKYDDSKPKSQQQALKKAESIETVSAGTLLRDYEANHIRAERTYKGKTLRIQGRVQNVSYANGMPYVSLNTPGLSTWIKCFVAPDDPLLLEIDSGKYVTIQGIISEVEGVFNPYTVINCKIISTNDKPSSSENPFEELFNTLLTY